jgi:hypothetical protein
MGLRRFARGLLCLGVILEASSGGAPTRAATSVQDPLIIEGEVKDRAGQLLPGVSVTALPERGGRVTHVTTGRDGRYRVEASSAIYRIDFELRGFTGIRRNHVLPGPDGRARIDAVLAVRPLCECVTSGLRLLPRDVSGQVVDDVGQPLPHARLEITGPKRKETAYADSSGRFRVRPPAEGTFSVVASDSGFSPVARTISKAATAVAFRLKFVGTQDLPDTETFNHECPCPEYFVLEER